MATILENMAFEKLLEENKKLKAENSDLQFQINQMKRLLYGSKRERYIPNKEDENQMTLPFEVPKEEEPEKEQEVITYVREKKRYFSITITDDPGKALKSYSKTSKVTCRPMGM